MGKGQLRTCNKALLNDILLSQTINFIRFPLSVTIMPSVCLYHNRRQITNIRIVLTSL